jgi:chaperonin GroES
LHAKSSEELNDDRGYPGTIDPGGIGRPRTVSTLAGLASTAVPERSSKSSDEKQSIRMIADRILCVPSREAGDRKSRSGILIPATADVSRRLVWADVAAVGPTVRTIETGDSVLFSPESGFEVEIQGDEYLILRERDVHAVASPRDEGGTGLYL